MATVASDMRAKEATRRSLVPESGWHFPRPHPAGTPGATGVESLRPRENGPRSNGGERGKTDWIFRDSSLNSTIPELPGSGWLAAEPEATPQTHRLRPWGFPRVSPSHPNVSPHHGIQRITVEFSEKSRFFRKDRPVWCRTERKGSLVEIGPHSVFVNPVVGV